MHQKIDERTNFDDTNTRKDELQNEKIEEMQTLRNMHRSIPAEAMDFDGQVDLLSGRIQLSIQRNHEIKADIDCLKAEKENELLISKMEDESKAKNDFENNQLTQRVTDLQQEYADVIENGNNIFDEYMDNINNQAKEEQALSEEIHILANKNNMVLTSKLSANRGDFERLKN
jgi:hypothetical protein